MKNKYHKLVAVILAAMCFAGCQQEDIVYPESDAKVAETYLTLEQLTQSPVIVQGTEGTYIMKVISDDKWTLTSSQAWCSVSETEGFKYSQVSISFSENPWNESRTAELAFVIEESQEVKVVTVEQEASETSLAVDSKELQYNIGGGEKSIILQTNAVEWNVEIVDETTHVPVQWCSVTPTTGKGTTTLKVTAESNKTEILRKASLVFTAVDKSLSIPIVQADQLEAPVIALDDYDDFLLSWNEIIGVDGYKLKIIAEQDETLIDIPSGTVSYDLDVIDWKDYVGMISIQLFSYANIGEGTITQMGSEIIEVHNLFDETSGNGEEGSEYIITKPRHLRNVGKYLDKNYKQIVDIDLTDVDLSPISTELVNNTYDGSFTGVYEATKGSIVDAGTGRSSEQYKIKNWTLDKSSNINCGLFASIGAEGIVRNVCIENAVIEAKAKVGAIAGTCSGKIISCHVTGSDGSISTPITTDAEVNLGGVVGYLTEKGEVSYCSNTAKVEGTAACVGGIVGVIMRDANNAPTVAYCINKATVICNTKSPLGGVIGSIAGGAGSDLIKIIGCANTGAVSGTQANNQVGGVVGRATIDTEISRCYNTGSITATGSAGGIVGRMGGTVSTVIKDCYNAGMIKSTGTVTNGNSNAAGILATCTVSAGGDMTIENCHNVGSTVTLSGAIYASGIFNRTDGKIAQITMTNCFSLDEEGKSQNSNSDSYIIGGASAYRNLSVNEMKNTSSFIGWNFSTIWEMGSEFPILRGLSE